MPVNFQSPAYLTTGLNPDYIAVADLNGDHIPDLVVTDKKSMDSTVFLADGHGGYTSSRLSGGGNTPYAVAIGDVNGDGIPDLVIADGSPHVLIGNGDGTFKPGFQLGGNATFVTLADMNGDGRPDIVANVGLFGEAGTLVSLNDGSGHASKTSYASSGSITADPTSLAVGDVDEDGLPDVVAIVPNIGIQELLGDGAGGIVASNRVFNGGTTPVAIKLADLNGDGHLDIVTADSAGNAVDVLLGNGRGGFAPRVAYSVGNAPSALAVADVNGDGIMDIVATNMGDNTVSVLLGDGTGKFGPAQSFAAGFSPVSLVVADLNGDGRPDIAVADASGGVAILYGTPFQGNNFTAKLREIYGDNVGSFTWNSAANWVSGVPTNGAAANVFTGTVDDIANLALATLSESATGATSVIDSALNVGNAVLNAGAQLLAQANLGPAFVAVGAITGGGALVGASGAGAIFSDLASNDPGEFYLAQNGGLVELAAAPSAASILQYGGTGSFALFHPGASNAVAIAGLGAGDRLELPGNAVRNVTFSTHGLTVTTDGGSYAFTNVATSGHVTGFTVGHDAATGLEALTFNAHARAADFNGDGTSDMLWQTTSGAIVDFSMANAAITMGTVVGALDGSFRFLAAGDFNGDGTTDQLWQNGTGGVLDYAMSNGAISGVTFVAQLSAQFVAAGDFNGDGTADMLLETSTGSLIDDTMQNGAVASSATIGSVAPGTKFLAAADFNGDGTTDQLWQQADGTLLDFTMANATISAVNVVGALGSSMRFLAAADDNGDGRADMMWQNTATGALVDYAMNGPTITGAAIVGALDSTFHFLAAGDFNGDGTADMLWQTNAGAIVDYSMHNGAISGGSVVGALDGSFKFLV